MIAAAALCPAPPLLARELTGADPVVPDLREACRQAAAALLASRPDVVAVVGAAEKTADWDPGGRLDLAAYAPMLGARAPGRPCRWPLGLGARLLDQAGYQGRRVLQSVSPDEPGAACAELGADLAGRPGGWPCWSWPTAAPGAAAGRPATWTSGARRSTPRWSGRCAPATWRRCWPSTRSWPAS